MSNERKTNLHGLSMSPQQVALRAYNHMLSSFCDGLEPREAYQSARRFLALACEQTGAKATEAHGAFSRLCREHDVIGLNE